MHSMLGQLSIFGIEIQAYHLVRWIYFLAAALLTVFLAQRRGTRPLVTVGAFLVGIPFALVGGHLLNVFEAWPSYRDRPEYILDFLFGGSSVYGALVFGVLSGIAYLSWRGVMVRRFLDAAAPAMALGEVMTRLGCFLNGCCFGKPTLSAVAVTFPRGSPAFAAQIASGLVSSGSDHSLPVHPTQLYSAAICTGLFLGLLWVLARDRLFPGALFCVFLFGYGLQRLIVGSWRADTALYWWELSNTLGVATVIVAVGLWSVWRLKGKRIDQVNAQPRVVVIASPGV